MKKIFLFIGIVSLALVSCKKDPSGEAVVGNNNNNQTTTPATTGSLAVEFDNMFDTLNLGLDTVQFTLSNGNKINFSKFNYYISNVKLTASDGSVYTEAESYHLIQESVASSQTITLTNVPFKNYTSMSFMIGVDSTRNVSGAQTDALDPANNMFWTWNTGYIMLKVEGTSQQSTAPSHMVAFHIGGFKGQYSALKTVNISFNGSTANVSSTVIPEVHLKCDLNELFVNPVTLDLSTTNNITMVNATSKSIADNYADMFSLEHIHN